MRIIEKMAKHGMAVVNRGADGAAAKGFKEGLLGKRKFFNNQYFFF